MYINLSDEVNIFMSRVFEALDSFRRDPEGARFRRFFVRDDCWLEIVDGCMYLIDDYRNIRIELASCLVHGDFKFGELLDAYVNKVYKTRPEIIIQ